MIQLSYKIEMRIEHEGSGSQRERQFEARTNLLSAIMQLRLIVPRARFIHR